MFPVPHLELVSEFFFLRSRERANKFEDILSVSVILNLFQDLFHGDRFRISVAIFRGEIKIYKIANLAGQDKKK